MGKSKNVFKESKLTKLVSFKNVNKGSEKYVGLLPTPVI